MNRQSILRFLRLETITGHHLNSAFIEPAIRHTGWQKIQRARRIARRLDIDPRCLPQL